MPKSVIAQDPVYSQYQAVWSYSNPSLTAYHGGLTFRGLRRDQWFLVQRSRSRFTSNSFNVGWNVPCLRSGFGAFYNESVEGEGGMRWAGYGMNYAFIAPIGGRRKKRLVVLTDLRFGLSISYNQRRLVWDRLVFSGQLDPFLGIVASQAVPSSITENSNISYLDMAVGGSFRHYFLEKDFGFRLGAAAHHINKPQQSLLGSEDIRLPWRWMAHGSLQIERFSPLIIIPGVKVDWQSSSTTAGVFSPDSSGFTYWAVNYGVYAALTPSPSNNIGIFGGVWLRSRGPIPDQQHTTTLTTVLGLVVNQREYNYKIGLSYDVNVGGVGSAAGGAAEVSLSVNLPGASPCGGKAWNPYSKYSRPLYF